MHVSIPFIRVDNFYEGIYLRTNNEGIDIYLHYSFIRIMNLGMIYIFTFVIMNRLHAVPSYLRRYGYSTKVFLYTPSKVPSKYLHSFVRTDNMYNNKVNTRTWISDKNSFANEARKRKSRK